MTEIKELIIGSLTNVNSPHTTNPQQSSSGTTNPQPSSPSTTNPQPSMPTNGLVINNHPPPYANPPIFAYPMGVKVKTRVIKVRWDEKQSVA
jgi:hypothetical protein